MLFMSSVCVRVYGIPFILVDFLLLFISCDHGDSLLYYINSTTQLVGLSQSDYQGQSQAR